MLGVGGVKSLDTRKGPFWSPLPALPDSWDPWNGSWGYELASASRRLGWTRLCGTTHTCTHMRGYPCLWDCEHHAGILWSGYNQWCRWNAPEGFGLPLSPSAPPLRLPLMWTEQSCAKSHLETSPSSGLLLDKTSQIRHSGAQT